jgi:YHS domain-containing protein
MQEKKVLFLISMVFIIGISRISFAMVCNDSAAHSEHLQVAQASGMDHDHEMATKADSSPSESVNVGNKICPVSGEVIGEETKATYEYNGKVYNFCCEGCIGKFKANPAKYIKIIEEEKSNSQSITNK